MQLTVDTRQKQLITQLLYKEAFWRAPFLIGINNFAL